MAVERGTIHALLGPNGAGKTTTIDLCEGFTAPDSGMVRVLGLDPWRQADELRPRLGVMLQAGGARGPATTAEMLHLVASCAAHPHQPEDLLRLVGLDSAARTPVRRLSGGQMQRLSLAMALVGRPELLFLDEPTAGMDPQARHLVWDVLSAARRDGVTIVLTTHLLDEVELLADQVTIIDHGKAIAQGTPSELTGAATEIRFVISAAVDTAPLADRLPSVRIDELGFGRYRLSGDLPRDATVAVAQFAAESQVELHSLESGRRSLDDVYVELTGRAMR